MENITLNRIATLNICNIKTLLVTDAFKLNFLINGMFTLTLSVFIILFNGAVLWTLLTKTKTTLGGASKTLLMVLSLVDFVSGCTHIPLKGLLTIQLFMGMENLVCLMYKVVKVLAYTTTLISAFTILFISGEYYLSLVKPLFRSKKQDFVIGLQMGIISVLILVTSIVFQGVYLQHSSKFVFVSSLVLLFIYICVCTLHFKIYQEMRRMRKRSLSTYCQSRTLVRKAVKKTLKMLTVISMAFAICFLPYIVLTIYEALFGESKFTLNFVRIWCDTIVTVNAIVDPIVYCLRLKAIRENCWPIVFLPRCMHKKSLTINKKRKIGMIGPGGSRYKTQTHV